MKADISAIFDLFDSGGSDIARHKDEYLGKAAAVGSTGDSFKHVDSQRTIVFGLDALEHGEELLGEGFTLLSTKRMARDTDLARSTEFVFARAASVIEVPSGPVSTVAAQLRSDVSGQRLVALGGGRVIDVAKALAAADPPRTLLAIPTTLSGAEMTGKHRHAEGVPLGTPHIRPSVVLNAPQLSASAPVESLAASSANALGHALVALTSDRATPISSAAAHESVLRLTRGWGAEQPQRVELALGALLSGWAVDHTGLGLHHVLAQTAVRTAGLEHAQANAALLPVSIGALRKRRPEPLERLDQELGREVESVARLLRGRAGVNGLGALVQQDELLARAVSEVAARQEELERIPPAPDEQEIRKLYLVADLRSGS